MKERRRLVFALIAISVAAIIYVASRSSDGSLVCLREGERTPEKIVWISSGEFYISLCRSEDESVVFVHRTVPMHEFGRSDSERVLVAERNAILDIDFVEVIDSIDYKGYKYNIIRVKINGEIYDFDNYHNFYMPPRPDCAVEYTYYSSWEKMKFEIEE